MEDIDGGLHPAVDGQSLDDEMMMIPVRLDATKFFFFSILVRLDTTTVFFSIPAAYC